MALLVFLTSLLLALLALRGWPAETGVWMRALIALAFLLVGTGVMLFAKSSPEENRLTGSRRRRTLDQVVGGLCLVMLIGVFYFILVFAPPATRELHVHVVTTVKERMGWDAQNRKPADEDDADSERDAQGYEMEVGGLFDPNGAVVPKSADLAPSSEPAVSLKMPDRAACDRLRAAGPIYLHLFSHHMFDGERWTSPNWSAFRKLSPGPDGWIPLEIADDAPAHRYTILRHELSSGLDALCTLQGARRVRLPEVAELNEGTWLLPPPDNPFGIIRPYQAASTPKSFRNLLASGARIEPDFAGSDYLEPSKDKSLNLLIRDLAAAFRRNSSLEEQLADLQARMSNSFVYSMQLDYPDKSKSPLESFLEDPGKSKGFCVHFASATALILREFGVHSRVSYGWAGGEFYPEHNQFVFRSEDGHAWTEIYLKDHGWVVFETTPPSGLPGGATAEPGTKPPGSAALIEGLDLSDSDREGAKPGSDFWQIWSSPVVRWMLIVFGAAAVGTVLLILIRQNRYAGIANPESAAAGEPPGYLQLLFRVCEGQGHPKAPGDTLRQYLRQLEEKGMAVPFADELLAYHYRVTYHESDRDAQLEKRLRTRIKEL